MQTSFASSGAMMPSAIPAGEGNAGVADMPFRTADRPAVRRSEAPKTALRQRLRRLLLFVVPVVMSLCRGGILPR